MPEMNFVRKATKLHNDALLSTEASVQLALVAPLIKSRGAESNAGDIELTRSARNIEKAVLKTYYPLVCFIIQLPLSTIFTIRFIRFGVFNTVQLAAASLLSLFSFSLLSLINLGSSQ